MKKSDYSNSHLKIFGEKTIVKAHKFGFLKLGILNNKLNISD